MSSATGGTTTSYSYDVNNPLPLLASESNAGGEQRRYVWGAGLLLSMRTGGADYYIAHDSQGSVMAVTSPSGATESLFTYNPFGAPRTTTNVDPNAPSIPLRFEAQHLDPTGIYQLRARSMNPATGTFLSPDPLAPPDTSPAISPYLYATDQPTVLSDPSGEFSILEALTFVPVVGDFIDAYQTGEALARDCPGSLGSASCENDIIHGAILVAGTVTGIDDTPIGHFVTSVINDTLFPLDPPGAGEWRPSTTSSTARTSQTGPRK
jgi:RHS repeat-associated protein